MKKMKKKMKQKIPQLRVVLCNILAFVVIIQPSILTLSAISTFSQI